MNILHILGIGTLPRDPDAEATGGLTRVAVELARRQAERGHRVVVATIARAPWEVRWRGVHLVSVSEIRALRRTMAGRKIDGSILLPLLMLTTRTRFDVIHAHEYPYLRYLPSGVRLTHFHNDPYSSTTGDSIDTFESGACLAAARYSHASIAVSRFIRSRLLKRYELLAPALPHGFDAADRTKVVYNGVDLARLDPDRCGNGRDRFRKEWNVEPEDVVFLYSGAIAPEKGVLELARAFVEVSRARPRARLVLAGTAHLWEDETSRAGVNDAHVRYQRKVREVLAGVTAAGRVIHAGLIPPISLPGVYSAADVVVTPSVVQEAFCLSAAEGLAMGKPLLASRVGGLVEFADESNSILVPPADVPALGDALRSLIDDARTRDRLRASARSSISSFTWDRAVLQLEDIYLDIRRRKRAIVVAAPPAFYRV